jgi:hypothetical protein
MSVDAVAAEVVQVLARARSLFAGPDIGETIETNAAEAAEASATIAGHVADMSGSFATAHQSMLDVTATDLHDATGLDARLADHICEASDTARAGAEDAGHVHTAADGVSDTLDPWSDLPVAELAALKALRAHIAQMQQLTAHHGAEAQRLADEIAALEYGQ